MKCVLVLAGLDPSGGAGLLADAEAVRAAGARPLCVATALTVQTTKRARRFEAVDVRLIEESALALLEEEDVRAVKIGMIGSEEIGDALDALLPRALPRVVDPVLRASSGASLLSGSPEVYLRLARDGLLTPNLPEAFELGDLGPAVLLKGGHREGETVFDTLITQQGREDFRGSRIAVRKRGTGCRLASFIAGRLALGSDVRLAPGPELRAAVLDARSFVRTYLQAP